MNGNLSVTELELGDAGHGASPGTLRSLRAIAEAVFATEEGPPPAERLDWACAELDDMLARSGSKARWLLRLSVLSVSLLAPLFVRRIGRLRTLPLGERIEAVSRMEESRLALPLLAVKAALCIVYYEHPDTAAEIGFDGRCMIEPPRRRLSVSTSEAER